MFITTSACLPPANLHCGPGVGVRGGKSAVASARRSGPWLLNDYLWSQKASELVPLLVSSLYSCRTSQTSQVKRLPRLAFLFCRPDAHFAQLCRNVLHLVENACRQDENLA